MSDAAALRQALAARAIDCEVEARERLAVLLLRSPVPNLGAREEREALVALALQAGFTHIALELTEVPGSDAALPGGQLP